MGGLYIRCVEVEIERRVPYNKGLKEEAKRGARERG